MTSVKQQIIKKLEQLDEQQQQLLQYIDASDAGFDAETWLRELERLYVKLRDDNRLLTAYDSQYLAVAERLKCEFWTADSRLVNAVAPHLTWVKWMGNFKTDAN
jgi:hypothetical protein